METCGQLYKLVQPFKELKTNIRIITFKYNNYEGNKTHTDTLVQ